MLIYSEVWDEDDPNKPFMMKQEYNMHILIYTLTE